MCCFFNGKLSKQVIETLGKFPSAACILELYHYIKVLQYSFMFKFKLIM